MPGLLRNNHGTSQSPSYTNIFDGVRIVKEEDPEGTKLRNDMPRRSSNKTFVD